jgi:hypothetical protein
MWYRGGYTQVGQSQKESSFREKEEKFPYAYFGLPKRKKKDT